MCLADYSIMAHCVLPRRHNGAISQLCHHVWLLFFHFFFHLRTLYYSEKAISPSSLIEFPLILLAMFKSQMCHIAENISKLEM